MSDSNPEIPLKQCSNGEDCVHPDGCWQPNDAEHFYQRKRGKQCKACQQYKCRQWKQENHEHTLEYTRQWRKDNHKELLARRRQRREENTETERERQRIYRMQHREALLEKRRQQYRERPESHRARARNWKRRNRDRIREYERQIYSENPGKLLVHVHRRKARVRSLPNTLTTTQWERALNYFNGCCAVCGRQLNDLFGTHTAAIDHWRALSDSACPGTTALNCIPLCHGVGGCNNRKGKKLAEEWIKQDFPHKAKAILTRIETYFAWVREQDGE